MVFIIEYFFNFLKISKYSKTPKKCFAVYLFETLSRLKEENSILPDDKKIPEVIKCPICRAVLDISPGDFRKHRPKKTSVVKRTSMPTDQFAKMAISRQRV